MAHPKNPKAVSRRTVIKAAAAAGALQFAPPFILAARGEQPVKIGLDNPLTGTFAAVGKNELVGCQLAIEQINAKGGILGRPAELLVEDSTSGDAGTAVQKARKLIDRDKVDFLLGNVNSALALAMAAGEQREEGPARRPRRAHRRGHRGDLPLERVPGVQPDPDGSQRRDAGAHQERRQEVVLHHARLRLRPHAAAGPRDRRRQGGLRQGGGRPHPARHHGLLLVPDQGRGGQARRDHHPPAGRRHDQLHQAGRAVRPRQARPSRGRPAGARGARGPAARGAHRHLGLRVVLEPAERPARQGVRRGDPQEDRQGAHGADLVRLRVDLDLRARGQQREVARRGQDGQGAAGHEAAARGRP